MTVSRQKYKPGQDLTVLAAETLAAGRFVKPSTAKTDGANLTVVYADAGDVPLACTAQDIDNAKIGHARALGGIYEVESSATITALALVKVANDGKIAAAADGDAVIGRTLTGGDNGDRLLVQVFANPAIVAPAATWPNG